MADAPNYHIFLWPEPPTAPTYLCLLCPLADCTEAEILAHLALIHAATPVPTPVAANPPPPLEETVVLTAPNQDNRRSDG